MCHGYSSALSTLWDLSYDSYLPETTDKSFETTPMLLPGSTEFKNPVPSSKASSKSSLSHAFYNLSTCGLSTDRHSFACHCVCVHILTLKPRIHANQFFQFISATSYPSQPPRSGLHFCDPYVQPDDLPQGWSSLGCYTWVPPTVLL